MKLAYSEWEIARWNGTAGDATDFIKERLQSTFGDKLDQSSVKVENGKVFATVNNIPYEYNTVTGTSGEKKPGIGDFVTKDNYGDYIDLGQDMLGDSNTANDWRILYNDKAGHVYAILADYLPNSNAAVAASGLNVVSGKTYNVNSTLSSSDLVSKLGSTTAWQSLIPERLRSTCQVKGAITDEIIIASYNEKYNTSYAYTTSAYFRTIPGDKYSPIDLLYMPHPGAPGDYNGCQGFWLASEASGGPNRVRRVANDGAVYHWDCDDSRCGLRPVVSLPSNIQVTKSGTVWTVVQ